MNGTCDAGLHNDHSGFTHAAQHKFAGHARCAAALHALKHCLCSRQVDWGKGRALSHMLTALGLDGADDVVPIYLGDDRTDEDAFKVLKERATGFGILISNKVSLALACGRQGQSSLAHSLRHSLTNL